MRQGGTAVLAETPEIYGAEHLLVARAASPGIADALMARIAWWRDYVARNRGSLDNNPSPGNKLGGLTTILEKSLGAVAKGGTTPLNGVYEYAEAVTARGFVFMDSPGYDPASVTGQIAGGCNLVAFTTGRGSTFGSKPAPCLKIATNTEMYARLSDDMDIDAGTIVSAGQSVAEVGDRIYARLLEVASGAPTLSEGHGLGDNEFVPWQIGANDVSAPDASGAKRRAARRPDVPDPRVRLRRRAHRRGARRRRYRGRRYATRRGRARRARGPGRARPRVRGRGDRAVRRTGMKRFVEVRGGAYFFLPGLRALHYLSQLTNAD